MITFFILFILCQQESPNRSLEDLQRQLIALQDRLPKKPVTQKDLVYFKKDLENFVKENTLHQESLINKVMLSNQEAQMASRFWATTTGLVIASCILFLLLIYPRMEKAKTPGPKLGKAIKAEAERAATMTDDPILVIGHPGQNQITGQLRKAGFRVERWDQAALGTMNLDGFKLFVFENLDEEGIEACIDKIPAQEAYVAYWTGSRHLNLPESVNVAGNQFMLYTRLMEVARYRSLFFK